MAQSQDVSNSTVNNIWQAHKLQPHPPENFQAIARSEASGEDDRRGGSVLNPPQQAIALCVDEKSQIQALDRTQPGLPTQKGVAGR
jgi:hypothetical protein